MQISEIKQGQSYASKKQLSALADYMQAAIKGSEFKAKGRERGKPINHIRVHQATQSEIDTIAKSIGLVKQAVDDTQEQLSSMFKSGISSYYDRLGTLYSFVISTKGSGTGVGKKTLTPSKLGLTKPRYSRDELIDDATLAVKSKIRDTKLQDVLLKLIKIAAARGNGSLTDAELDYIQDNRSIISTDFGEILAPIYVMADDDFAEFPQGGNNPIIDVTVGNKSYAVKSLSGSGNSFSVISDLMDRYEESLEDGSPEQAKYEIVKIFNKKNPGSGKDKIIQASFKAETAESQALASALGRTPVNHQDLINLVAQKIKSGTGYKDYASFIKFIYPITTAGAWGVPAGLPADGEWYRTGGRSGAAPRGKSAGKASYDRNPVQGATDIIIYILGVGLLNQATKGKDAEVYNKMMTDMVNQSNVYLGKIDITDSGALEMAVKPFSGLRFRFDYHAPSNKPANNLPGFIIAKG